MAAFNGIPYAGPLQIALDDCKDDLIDLPPDTLVRLRKVKPGIENVRSELQNSIPAHGESAGIVGTVYSRFVKETTLVDKLRIHEAELEKALEMVRESRAKAEHDRENTVAQIVDSVKSTSARTGNGHILAPFEKTIDYHRQVAVKAAQTRRKNKQAPQEPSNGNG